jgi:hypothetical protein
MEKYFTQGKENKLHTIIQFVALIESQNRVHV